MKKVLFVDCCIRGEESRTWQLCQTFLEELKQKYEGITVEHLPVYQEELKNLDGETLSLRDRLVKEKSFENPMFDYAKALAAADYILIGAPYWDLSFPACLKTYIERSSVSEITFTYVGSESVGLCRAKKMMYISTAGGFVPGPHAGEEYMRQISVFFGIHEFEAYCLEGLDIWGMDVEAKMREARDKMRALANGWMKEA